MHETGPGNVLMAPNDETLRHFRATSTNGSDWPCKYVLLFVLVRRLLILRKNGTYKVMLLVKSYSTGQRQASDILLVP